MSIDLHALLAPYALDALDADERARFEGHLDSCATCRDELGGFSETAVRLAESTPLTPPEQLRARLMAAVAEVPQERPTVVALRPSRRASRVLSRVAVAAAVIVAAAAGTGYVVEHDQVVSIRAEQNRYEQIMSAADADVRVAELPDGTTVRMIHSADADGAVVVVNGLPKDTDTSYQLWALDGSSARSQGTFDGGNLLTVSDLGQAERVAITREPKGGSERPTTPPIASMDL